MNIYDKYLILDEKYNKLLDNYAKLVSLYRETNRTLYHNNKVTIAKIRQNILQEYKNSIGKPVKPVDYFCPFIKEYCLYFNSDFCISICNEKRR